jgi:predicted O-methyltransferase YrrM
MDRAVEELLAELHHHGREHDARFADRLLRLRNLEPETGALLNLLVRTLGAASVLELGTSNGYSTVWLAEAVAHTGGRVVTVELDAERSAQAGANLERAGLAAVVERRVGDAGAVLAQLPPGSVDLVFLDAERAQYPDYLDDLMRVTRRPGLLACDNAISHAAELTAFRALVDADPGTVTVLDGTGAGVLLVALPA